MILSSQANRFRASTFLKISWLFKSPSIRMFVPLVVVIEADDVLRNFCMCWKMSEILITSTWHHKNCHGFCVSVWLFSSLKKCSTHWTLQCRNCLFYMNKHKDMMKTVKFVRGGEFKMKWYIKEIYQQSTTFVLVSSQRCQDFRHILQNLKVSKHVMGSNDHNLWHKLLNRIFCHLSPATCHAYFLI